jgi:hypothetical protein
MNVNTPFRASCEVSSDRAEVIGEARGACIARWGPMLLPPVAFA